MQISFNPKDTNTFASSSLDRTIKVWGLGQPNPNFTLEGHDKGVNCVDYFTGEVGGDRERNSHIRIAECFLEAERINDIRIIDKYVANI